MLSPSFRKSAPCAGSGSFPRSVATAPSPLSTTSSSFRSSFPSSPPSSSGSKTASARRSKVNASMASPSAAAACRTVPSAAATGETVRSAAAAAAEQATTSAAYAEAASALSLGPSPPLPAEFSRWVRRCNAPPGTFGDFFPWKIDGVDVGLVRPGFAEELRSFPEVFSFVTRGDDGDGAPRRLPSSSPPSPAPLDRPSPPDQYITFNPKHSTPRQRTDALSHAMLSLRDRGIILGWRDELFPVSRAFGEEPLCLIERAAAVHMGIRAYGIHLNGYVSIPEAEGGGGGGGAGGGGGTSGGSGGGDGEGDESSPSPSPSPSPAHRPTHLWIATRSSSKPTWPGKLDHLVAGGQPASLSILENVVKECAEEAGVPESLVSARARPAGVVSYASLSEEERGCKRDVLFVYDLELPVDFVPSPCDGEVERFDLLPVEHAAALVARSDRFKDNCNLVLADFFVRHGVLRPDDGGYLELVAGLRPGLGEFA